MKFIQYVQEYGTRPCIRVNYSQESLFFTGQEPTKYTLITLELPGLTAINYADIARWLSAKGFYKGEGKRDALYELPAHLWRPTVLNDFLDSAEESARWSSWQITQQFSLGEINTFLTEWLPVLEQRLREIDQKTVLQERVNIYKKYQTFLSNLLLVIYQVNGVLAKSHQETIKRLEQEQLTVLRQKTINITDWVKTAASFQTHELIMSLMIELAKHLVQPPLNYERLLEGLEQIWQKPSLRQATQNQTMFWNVVKSHLHLPPTLTGETIDLSQAQEVVAPLSWDLWHAERVGQCTPGRRVLLVTRPNKRNIYIAAERKFKFQVAAAGGQLTRHNNNFVMGHSNPLNKALLEVELLDSLAQVNPQAALQRVAHLNLPPNHPVFAAAQAANTDYRQSRLLGDLLIELVLGVDADVARNLVRAHAESARGKISLWI